MGLQNEHKFDLTTSAMQNKGIHYLKCTGLSRQVTFKSCVRFVQSANNSLFSSFLSFVVVTNKTFQKKLLITEPHTRSTMDTFGPPVTISLTHHRQTNRANRTSAVFHICVSDLFQFCAVGANTIPNSFSCPYEKIFGIV